MSIKLVEYSDSDDSDDSNGDQPESTNHATNNGKKRDRTETENSSSDSDHSDGKEPPKKRLKLSGISIKQKLSQPTSNKIEFLQSKQKHQKDVMLNKRMKNELNKIETNNHKRQNQFEYKQRLKEIEEDKLRKEEGLKKKKEHKKYLQKANKEHIDMYGDKVKVKGIGKGSHTKNQRRTW